MTTPQASGIAVHCAHTAIVDIEKVTPHPRNYNRHPEKQIALLAKMIRARGWRNPIVVSKRSGFIIKGHARLEAAKLLNVAQVPIDEQEFADEATEYAEMIADNRIAELAEPNLPAIADLLQELDTGAMDMDLTGFSESELERVMNYESPNGAGRPSGSEADQSPFAIMVNCTNESQQSELLARLAGEGLSCRAL